MLTRLYNDWDCFDTKDVIAERFRLQKSTCFHTKKLKKEKLAKDSASPLGTCTFQIIVIYLYFKYWLFQLEQISYGERSFSFGAWVQSCFLVS